MSSRSASLYYTMASLMPSTVVQYRAQLAAQREAGELVGLARFGAQWAHQFKSHTQVLGGIPARLEKLDRKIEQTRRRYFGRESRAS